MATQQGVASDQEVMDAVWPLIATADLSTITSRDIRNKVEKVLGPGRIPDGEQGKLLMRSVIEGCLLRRDDETEQGARLSSHPGPVAEAKEAPEGESHDSEHSPTAPSNRVKKTRGVTADADGQERSMSADKSGPTVGKGKNPKPSSAAKNPSKKRRKPIVESDDDEANGSEVLPSDDLPKPRSPKEKKVLKRRTSEEKPKRGNSRSRSAQPGTKLARVLRIARELGCPIPPSRLRCEASEKVSACLKHLETKGIVDDVFKLTKDDIARLKADRERQNELNWLDEGNIISSDQKRSRRSLPRQSPEPAKQKKAEEAVRAGGSSDDSSSRDGAGQSDSEFELEED